MKHGSLGLKFGRTYSKPEKHSRLGLKIYEMNEITNQRIVTYFLTYKCHDLLGYCLSVCLSFPFIGLLVATLT
jgi:hypothetical protein